MPDWLSYKGVEVPDATPTGDAGLRLKDNFLYLADRSNSSLLLATATKTSNYTAAINDLVRADSSSSDFTVTLPASPSVNDRVGVLLINTNSGFESNALTVASNAGQTIFNEGSSLKLYCKGDYIEFQYHSTEKWIVVIDGRQPHVCEVTGSTSSAQSINDSTDTQLELPTTAFDNAGLGDTTNHRIAIRRAGKYRVNGYIGMSNANMVRLQLSLQVNGSDSRVAQLGNVGASAQWFGFNTLLDLSVGNLLTLIFYQDNTDNAARSLSTAGRSRPRLTAEEVR